MPYHLLSEAGNGKHWRKTIREIIDVDSMYWFNYLRGENEFEPEVHQYFCKKNPHLSYVEPLDELINSFFIEEAAHSKKMLAVRILVVMEKEHPLYKEVLRIAHL